MSIWPAQRDRQLFVIVFISVMLMLLIGSVVYKYGYIAPSDGTTDIYQTITEDIEPVEKVAKSTVALQLQPAQNANTGETEYQLILEGVEQPAIGMAIKLVVINPNPEVSISDVNLNETISNGPWQILINKAELDEKSNQPSLQFAATSTDLKTSVINGNTVIGSFTVSGSASPIFEIAGDSLLTTEDQAYDIVLSNN